MIPKPPFACDLSPDEKLAAFERLQKLVGSAFYEERLLFLLIRLRNPRAHVVYVTSQPVHPVILDYYLTLLMGIPASHARTRTDDALCV